MRINTSFYPVLTDVPDRFLWLLTLFLIGTAPFQAHSAVDNSGLFDAYTQRPTTALDATEANQARGAFNDYLHAQMMNMVPRLSDNLRGTVNMATRAFQPVHSLMSVDMLNLGADDPPEPAPGAPLALNEPVERGGDDTSWMSSSTYHHRHGLLPTHDTMMMGSHAKMNFFDSYIHADLHPYFAQNYFSLANYYGSDLKFEFNGKSNGTDISRPWGSIALGYSNGQDRLMDRARGFNMNATLNFSDQFSLNSGISQNNADQTGNYVMLQWTLVNY